MPDLPVTHLMPIRGCIQEQHAALWDERNALARNNHDLSVMVVQHELLIRELTERVRELERLLGW